LNTKAPEPLLSSLTSAFPSILLFLEVKEIFLFYFF
jgi:hypothetical protein